MNSLIRALRWREDVASGVIIEGLGYNRTHLSWLKISQIELDAICNAANLYYKAINSNLRMLNHMGEIIPALNKD